MVVVRLERCEQLRGEHVVVPDLVQRRGVPVVGDALARVEAFGRRQRAHFQPTAAQEVTQHASRRLLEPTLHLVVERIRLEAFGEGNVRLAVSFQTVECVPLTREALDPNRRGAHRVRAHARLGERRAPLRVEQRLLVQPQRKVAPGTVVVRDVQLRVREVPRLCLVEELCIAAYGCEVVTSLLVLDRLGVELRERTLGEVGVIAEHRVSQSKELRPKQPRLLGRLSFSCGFFFGVVVDVPHTSGRRYVRRRVVVVKARQGVVHDHRGGFGGFGGGVSRRSVVFQFSEQVSKVVSFERDSLQRFGGCGVERPRRRL
mmetsp:Transcript_4583/g.11346  ORF Transcript_4583/g.11346 Transcript_4583/m.11346 type:complete len:316 (-) Transcript_4583:255-1202(-)